MLRAIIYISLTASAIASATLDVLVNAAASFSATIQQQLETLHSNPSPARIAKRTIDYATAKAAYFEALRAEAPEIVNIVTGKDEKPLELDTFAAAFAIASQEEKKTADQETLVLLKRYLNHPEIQKAMAEFERAQKAEESFYKDFLGLDFTSLSRYLKRSSDARFCRRAGIGG
jgi:tetratricopeptide (TPR) repeat protein